MMRSCRVFGPFFNMVVCSLIVKFPFFVYFGQKSIIKGIFCKYFLSICDLLSYSFDIVFREKFYFIFLVILGFELRPCTC
jgi:hypothetical protein